MKRRQQAMNSGSMMRGASGTMPNGQFTPGVAQFSAPRAIDEDPYGPFGGRGRPAASQDSWRSPYEASGRDFGAASAGPLSPAAQFGERFAPPAQAAASPGRFGDRTNADRGAGQG
jgi:hypothetical protein